MAIEDRILDAINKAQEYQEEADDALYKASRELSRLEDLLVSLFEEEPDPEVEEG